MISFCLSFSLYFFSTLMVPEFFFFFLSSSSLSFVQTRRLENVKAIANHHEIQEIIIFNSPSQYVDSLYESVRMRMCHIARFKHLKKMYIFLKNFFGQKIRKSMLKTYRLVTHLEAILVSD